MKLSRWALLVAALPLAAGCNSLGQAINAHKDEVASAAGKELKVDEAATMLAANPQLRWHNARRGYVTCRVTADTWEADYRTVPYVTRPDAPIETPARWRVGHGRPGIERV